MLLMQDTQQQGEEAGTIALVDKQEQTAGGEETEKAASIAATKAAALARKRADVVRMAAGAKLKQLAMSPASQDTSSQGPSMTVPVALPAQPVDGLPCPTAVEVRL